MKVKHGDDFAEAWRIEKETNNAETWVKEAFEKKMIAWRKTPIEKNLYLQSMGSTFGAVQVGYVGYWLIKYYDNFLIISDKKFKQDYQIIEEN